MEDNNANIPFQTFNPDSRFLVYINSLKNYDGDEFLNMMNDKIANNIEITKKELLMISLLCFMSSRDDVERTILNSAVTITNIPGLERDIAQFVKGVVLMLCDKFVEDEVLKIEITNLVGGNMKNVEDYALRVADKVANERLEEKSKSFVINLDRKGFTIQEIAETAEVSVDFVEKTLAK